MREQLHAFDDDMLKRVMFLCDGNHFRSRICEELFNHCIAAQGLPWNGFSRALLPNAAQLNRGPMSLQALELLALHGIPARNALRLPLEASPFDFRFSSIVIGVNETELRPLVDGNIGEFSNRVEYWHVADAATTTPQTVFDQILKNTTRLVERIRSRSRINDAA